MGRGWGLVAVLGVVAAGCSSGGDDGGGREADDDAVAMVVASGDVVAALQDERRATQAALLELPDQADRPAYDDAVDAVDEAFRDLGEVIDRLGPTDYGKAEPDTTGTAATVEGLRGHVAGALVAGREEALEDDLAGELDPLVQRMLVVQQRFVDDLDDPVAEVYARTSQMIEALAQVGGIAVSQPDWTTAVEPSYSAAIDAYPDIVALTEGTDIADATAALDEALTAAGFGGPPAEAGPGTEAGTGTPDDFVASFSLGAWRSYRDVVRQHVLPD